MNLHYIEKMKGFVDVNFAIFFKGNGNFAIFFFQWLEFRVFLLFFQFCGCILQRELINLSNMFLCVVGLNPLLSCFS